MKVAQIDAQHPRPAATLMIELFNGVLWVYIVLSKLNTDLIVV